MNNARIIEIFRSVQGEGIYAGEEQIFVRFHGCNLSCLFCDEREKGFFKECTPDELIDLFKDIRGESVSLTGGEPLLYADFLEDVLPPLKKYSIIFYLETNGTMPEELSRIIDNIDIVSMDVKLPSSTGERPFWRSHLLFLKEAVKKRVFVKAVVGPHTTNEDIRKAGQIVESVNNEIPFVLQPLTYNGNIYISPRLREFKDILETRLKDVRVIPQLHKLAGVR